MGRNLAKVGNNTKYPARSALDGFSTGLVTSASDATWSEPVGATEPTSPSLPESFDLVSGRDPLESGETAQL